MKKIGQITRICMLMFAILVLVMPGSVHSVKGITDLPPNGFNNDTYADLAVGVYGEDVESGENNFLDAGAVNILSGSPDGVTGSDEPLWHQDVAGVSGSAEEYDLFGSSLAVGDFNGDDYLDLAIGVSREDVRVGEINYEDAGAVNVIYGSPNGLTANNEPVWVQGYNGLSDIAEADDEFGFSLAAGDFNGDGYADLAIGVRFEEWANSGIDAGLVQVLYGSSSGLTATGNQVWNKVNLGLGFSNAGEWFGYALASGDFDRDGFSDLAVGVPFDYFEDYGSVVVIEGSAGGLTSTNAQKFDQDHPNLASPREDDDHFGYSLAVADFNCDSYADLAIGVPDEDVGTIVDAGAVNVLYGSYWGLGEDFGADEPAWNQDTPNVGGNAEAYDNFGDALAAGDLDGDGCADLAIGVIYEQVNNQYHAGAVNLLYGSSEGLEAIGDEVWTQNSTGMVDLAEAFDLFGLGLAIGDSDNDGYADLAVGVAGEGLGGMISVGAVHMLYGTSNGVTAARNWLWHQSQPGVADNCEADDWFGEPVVFGQWSTPLRPPDYVQAGDGGDNEGIYIIWDPVVADYYYIYRSVLPDLFYADILARTFGNFNFYYDDTPYPGQLYYYWIVACNTYGCSPFTDPESGYRAHSVYLPLIMRSP